VLPYAVAQPSWRAWEAVYAMSFANYAPTCVPPVPKNAKSMVKTAWSTVWNVL